MDTHLTKTACQKTYTCKYLDEKQLCAYLGISRSTIRRWMVVHNLPRPVHLGERCVRWRLADIEAWEEQAT